MISQQHIMISYDHMWKPCGNKKKSMAFETGEEGSQLMFDFFKDDEIITEETTITTTTLQNITPDICSSPHVDDQSPKSHFDYMKQYIQSHPNAEHMRMVTEFQKETEPVEITLLIPQSGNLTQEALWNNYCKTAGRCAYPSCSTNGYPRCDKHRGHDALPLLKK